MSPRRRPPLTRLQALAGGCAVLAAVAAIVALSYGLLLPVETVAPLPSAQEAGDSERMPGEVVCPRQRDVDARPVPLAVTSAELIECPAVYNGKQVRYAGEAVGAVLLRSDYAWLHLNDDRYASVIGPLSRHRTVDGGNSGMAVTVPRDEAIGVYAGHSRLHGTRVAVVGTFLRSDPRDAGAPSIAASEVEITAEAESFTVPVAPRRVFVAIALAAATLVLLVRLRLARRG
jgi:hypothetical protein